MLIWDVSELRSHVLTRLLMRAGRPPGICSSSAHCFLLSVFTKFNQSLKIDVEERKCRVSDCRTESKESRRRGHDDQRFLIKNRDGFNVSPIDLQLMVWKMWLNDFKGRKYKKNCQETNCNQIKVHPLFLSTFFWLHAARVLLWTRIPGSGSGHTCRVPDLVSKDLVPPRRRRIQHTSCFCCARQELWAWS